jgi:dihydrofolate synthase/folylpolyglutamate synthase
MTYNKIIKFLYNLKGSEEKGKGYNLNLNNVKKLVKKIGNPQNHLKVIHIAGTNGKGSVCAMLSSILKQAGYKVGMYTSPHLIDFRERFQIHGKSISKKDLIEYFNKIKKDITNQTFFEVVTALAFLYFKEKNVDYLILEVGLGGRLDATNVVNPLVSVITNISLEHTQLLGETVEDIAFEKAGIIKKNKPVVTGASGNALKVIKKIAKKNNSDLYLNKKYKKINNKFNINDYKNLRLNLKGDFQIENAALALTTIAVLKKYYSIEINKNHIKNSLLKIKWPGRFEFIKTNLLVDCAHNPAAALTLKKELLKIKYKKIILIIGILKDKDYKKILNILTPLAYKTILTKPSIPRARNPKELARYMKKSHLIINNTKKALKYAKNISKKDLIVVTGSIYTVGEALK